MTEARHMFHKGPITARTTAAVTGARFVGISADAEAGFDGGLAANADGANCKVAHCAADAAPLGVAAHDAASGAVLNVIFHGVVSVTSDGAITAGAEVEVGTAGKAKVYADGIKAGLCLNTVADGELAFIKLYS